MHRVKRDILSTTDFKSFFHLVSNARRASKLGKDWFCEDWETDVKDSLCGVDNTQPECVPEEFKCANGIVDRLKGCGANSVYGATF